MPPTFSDREILSYRPDKQPVSARIPVSFLNEIEVARSGRPETVATIFLTNRECPFKCLMCDLWQHTLDVSVEPGDIPHQIAYALERLEPAQHVKLYNSGNFFDGKAVPPSDYQTIADLVRDFDTVIVENHPSLCGPPCLEFRDLLEGRLEIALGLETAHPEVLASLNKKMTVEDFEKAARYLVAHDIDVRTFILLRPPFLSEAEGIEWALQSIRLAFRAGASTCSVIPTRAGNGIMEHLHEQGQFESPSIRSLELVQEQALGFEGGRVFADLWDIEDFYDCPACGPHRAMRLNEMNLTQRVPKSVACHCNGA